MQKAAIACYDEDRDAQETAQRIRHSILDITREQLSLVDQGILVNTAAPGRKYLDAITKTTPDGVVFVSHVSRRRAGYFGRNPSGRQRS